MLHIPILRNGLSYQSVEKTPILHHATGEPVAVVSQANSGLIVHDIGRMDDRLLESLTVAELLDMCWRAAELFMSANLPLGDPDGPTQTFDDYIRQLSATTGMPVTYCRNNAGKIHKVMSEMEGVIAGLTRGLELEVLDRGYGYQADAECGTLNAESTDKEAVRPPSTSRRGTSAVAGVQPRRMNAAARDGRMVSFFRAGRVFGAVLPSNSPGVHSLWVPAIAMKTPIVLKPGREEPWTPLRIIEALAAAGVPREAFGFYPTDHGGAAELLRNVDRGMIFGDTTTTRPWADDPRIEIHGPGFSKVILGDDTADHWERYLDIMVSSIATNGGRSCINASAVWTPRHGRRIAEALAHRLAKVEAWPADDPRAQIAAFAHPEMAERINAAIDHALREPGAVDATEIVRGSPRLVKRGRLAWLLPTVIHCGPNREHPLANREFLFPFASVVECPTAEMAGAIGPTLIASAVTSDAGLIRELQNCPHVDRLNLGPIPTWQISWDQPHEGNLFELLYRQRAFQMASSL